MRAPRRSLPVRSYAPRASLVAAAGAALAGVAVGLALLFSSLLGGLEQDTLGARFSLRAKHRPSGIVVVGIDDRSFAELQHRWPFPRSWHGRLLERLHRAGAKVVFYDVQFTEPTTPREDGSLFNALGSTGGAILATTQTDGHGHTNVLGGDANLAQVGSRAADSLFPLAVGGVIERVPYSLGGLDSAAVAVTERIRGHAPARSLFGRDGAYIDYQGPGGTIPEFSFADVLRGHFPPGAFAHKVVVVGATSKTLEDYHATPADSRDLMSGPEMQANAIWTVMNGLPLRPAPGYVGALLVLLAALLGPAARLRRGALAVTVASPAFGLAYLAAAVLAFDGGSVLPVVAPLAALVVSGLLTLISSQLLVTRELRAAQLEIVQRLGRAAESRDGATGRHLERMAFMSGRLALAAGLSRRDARLVRQASVLHDVGKIGIPDHVLLKPGRYEPQERAVMERHAALGSGMLAGSSTTLVQLGEMIARTHHERWDGSGYPWGLKGQDIPLVGRICALCDVFDALISRRPYKESWTLEDTLAEIARNSGTHFDPELTEIFLRIAPRLYRELTVTVDPDIVPRPTGDRGFAIAEAPAQTQPPAQTDRPGPSERPAQGEDPAETGAEEPQALTAPS